MKAFLAALATILRDPRTTTFLLALGVLAKRRGPVPLMVSGALFVLGVHATPLQSLGLILGFFAVVALELITRTAANAPVGLTMSGVAR